MLRDRLERPILEAALPGNSADDTLSIRDSLKAARKMANLFA
jgi:hypothetical protein